MSVGRCHSAFQHYEMFHGHGACHGGGNNYGSIFNITYNCNGKHGGFWSGLAGGLGYGIGSWLMGGLNMVGGWLGGMGVPMMGMPMFNWGGSAGRVGDGDYHRERNYRGERDTERVEVRYKDDIDHEIINKLSGEVKALSEKAKLGTVSPDEVSALNKKLDDAKAGSDANAKALDQGTYENLKGILAAIKTSPAAVSDPDALTGVDWSKITGLTGTDIAELENIGVKPIQIDGKNGTVWALSLPTNLTVDSLTKLKEIADARNIPVAVANNTAAALDKWIAGKLDKIEEKDGKLTYTVDCKDVGKLEYKHTVVQSEGNKYIIDRHSDSEQKAKNDGYIHSEQEFEFSDGLLRRNGESVNRKI